MIHRLALMMLCTLIPCLAQAGAWPRAEGTTFIAIGGAQLTLEDGAEQQETTLYAEHGLKQDYTLGFNGTSNVDSSGEGHIFLRLPPMQRPNGALFAFELGYGAKTVDARSFDQFAKLALSWSRGITLAERAGWLSIDSGLYWDLDADDNRLKIDVTFGWTASDRIALMGQIFFEANPFDESVTLAPSLVVNPNWGGSRIQLGLESKRAALDQTAIRLNIWSEF